MDDTGADAEAEIDSGGVYMVMEYCEQVGAPFVLPLVAFSNEQRRIWLADVVSLVVG